MNFASVNFASVNLDRAELDALYRYCLALSGERQDAWDLLHGALESVLRRRPRDIQHPAAYLRRTVRNRFYDQLRRAGSLQFERLENADAQPGAERHLESRWWTK